MTTVRINITGDDKDIQKIDDFIHKHNKKKNAVKTNRSKFMVESSLISIENKKSKRITGER